MNQAKEYWLFYRKNSSCFSGTIMLTNSNQTERITGGDENLHRKIDLVSGLLIAFLNIAEITMIVNIRRKKEYMK